MKATTDFLFARLASPSDLSLRHRTWNGNDTSQRNHNGAVPLAEPPFDIVLNWKTSAGAVANPVGCFRLNLSSLLQAGYIRRDRKAGQVRLRFYHDHDDCIYIQTSPGKPRLLIGSVAIRE